MLMSVKYVIKLMDRLYAKIVCRLVLEDIVIFLYSFKRKYLKIVKSNYNEKKNGILEDHLI
jgi:hypothetical protein